MTRSYRKHPIIGLAGAKGKQSEALDKRKNNRKLRNKIRKELKQDAEILSDIKDVSDPWVMQKDGKMWFDPIKYPELKRK